MSKTGFIKTQDDGYTAKDAIKMLTNMMGVLCGDNNILIDTKNVNKVHVKKALEMAINAIEKQEQEHG